MKKIIIIFNRDLKELQKTNAFLIIAIAFLIITIAVSVIACISLKRQEWLSQIIARPLLEMIISLIIYFISFSIFITFIWAFASLPVIKEKVNGNIESLLATPLSPVQIWMGKSLAIFLPAFIFSTISTTVVLFAVNLFTIKPATGNMIFPAPALLTGLLINPLLFFGLLLIIMLLNLANNPDLAIVPSFVIGFGLMMGVPLGVAAGKINLSSWTFCLWYLGGALLLFIVVCFLLRLLTKENIVLSSKGE